MFLKRYILTIPALNLLLLTVLGGVPDSLESRLKRATSDTAKVMIYNSIARDLLTGQNRDYYQIVQYAQQGSRIQDYQQALQYARQGLALAEQTRFERGKAELHRTLGGVQYYLYDYPKAIEHYEEALRICEKLRDFNGMAINYYNISLIYYTQQTKIYYQLEILQKALSLWKQAGNRDFMARGYDLIIRLYQSVGEWRPAKTFAEEALQLALDAGNRLEEASLYETLAEIHYSLGNTRERDEYYQKALRIYENLGDQLRIANITVTIANLLDHPETVIDLLRKSIAIYESISPANTQLFSIYNSLANQFQTLNNRDSAKYYKEMALSKAILSQNAFRMAEAHHAIGEYYMENNDLRRAEQEFRNGYDIAMKSGLYHVQSATLQGLSTIFDRRGEHQTAFDYLLKYQMINDSLKKEENKKNVQQLTIQYEFEKDMAEYAEIIRAQLERQRQAIGYQKTVAAIVSIALIGAALLLLFLIRNNHLNNKTNTLLERQHGEISRINDELQASHRELSRYKDSLEEMAREQATMLHLSEMQLTTLSDNLPGGCIYQKISFADGKQKVSYISSTAEKWLGLDADSLKDDINAFYRRMRPEDVEKKRRLERESVEGMTPHSFEYRMMKNGEEIWLFENVMPRADEGGTVAWDGIVADITERKRFERELIEAKERAEESDRLKSAFLANMSHEIRTPMNGIIGFLNFIERHDLPREKRRDYTAIIRANVQQLLQLIDDIVDISKMDSHQLPLHIAPCDVNNLLVEMETFFQDFVLKREKTLILLLDRTHFVEPCIVRTDPVRLRQILTNLIGNAVKFTERGYIRFGYQLMDVSPELRFFVEDSGIGIAREKQKYVFERFRQAHDAKTQSKYGGTGLGLAICKNLVELMGGSIGVHSDEGNGATFFFTIPKT